MMLIIDNLDNAEAYHNLGKSKKVNLNLNFAHKKYLISNMSWELQLETFKEMKINERALIKLPLAVSMHTKLYELKNIKLGVINDK